MNRERAEELYSDYIEGKLEGALKVAFEVHLQESPESRREVEELRSMWEMLGDAPEVEPPANFRIGVWERIEGAEAAKAQAPRRIAKGWSWRSLFANPVRLAGGAVAILLLVVLAQVVMPKGTTTAGLGSFGVVGSPRWSVNASKPTMIYTGGNGYLVFQLSTLSEATLKVRIKPADGLRAALSTSSTLELSRAKPVEVGLSAGSLKGINKLDLIVENAEQPSEQQVITVDAPSAAIIGEPKR